MSKVLVSIVCTNYNKGDWIAEAIESFLRQKVNFEYEILLIDDKSTDQSLEIIKEYAKKYPEKIRAFYNKKNLGITKTWIKICKEARGKYIARCDGDDYWIDDKKLQKQVDALEKNKNSQWCSTDYNIISSKGETKLKSAFKDGSVKRAKSYAEMLATKGFTMSSTWLVEASLMKDVNSQIDDTAIDDTFNIQLDLFHSTSLTYLPEATAVYRENEGSDSHPTELKVIKLRNEKLLKTQLEYIDKYKDVDYVEALKIALEQNMTNDMFATERLQIIHQQWDRLSRQSAHISELEEQLGAIQESRSYKLAVKMQKLASLPRKAMRRKNK